MNQLLVRDWMTPNPLTITPHTSIPEAHRLMRQHQCRRLPVLDGERLVGILTLGDVRNAEPPETSSLSSWEIDYIMAHVTVDGLMTPDPWTVQMDATILDAARIMLQHKIGGLPVVDRAGRLVGIITESDILRLIIHHFGALET